MFDTIIDTHYHTESAKRRLRQGETIDDVIQVLIALKGLPEDVAIAIVSDAESALAEE